MGEMTDEYIDDLEKQFGIALPQAYREVLRKNPLGSEFPDHEVTQLNTSKADLESANRLYREKGYYGRTWPSDTFWIGDDGSGGAFFLIGNSPASEEIYYIDWEDRSATFDELQCLKVADSIEEYLRQTEVAMRELIVELDDE